MLFKRLGIPVVCQTPLIGIARLRGCNPNHYQFPVHHRFRLRPVPISERGCCPCATTRSRTSTVTNARLMRHTTSNALDVCFDLRTWSRMRVLLTAERLLRARAMEGGIVVMCIQYLAEIMWWGQVTLAKDVRCWSGRSAEVYIIADIMDQRMTFGSWYHSIEKLY